MKNLKILTIMSSGTKLDQLYSAQARCIDRITLGFEHEFCIFLNMKLNSAIIYIFLFVWQPFMSAATQCEINKFNYFVENKTSRFGSIVMPSGETITVVGHIHGSRTVQDELLSFRTDRLSPDVASWIVKNEVLVLQHASEDYAFLLNQLKEQQISFIGTEFSPEIYNTYQPKFLSLIEKISFTRLTPSERRTILLRTLQAPLYAKYLAKNVVGDSINILPVESSEIDNKPFVNYIESRKKFFNLLNNDESRKWLTQHDNYLLLNYYPKKFDPKRKLEDREKLKEVIWSRKRYPEASYQDFVYWIDTVFEYLDYNYERDRYVAQVLSEQKKSGVHFTGFLHFEKTLDFLKKTCLERI